VVTGPERKGESVFKADGVSIGYIGKDEQKIKKFHSKGDISGTSNHTTLDLAEKKRGTAPKRGFIGVAQWRAERPSRGTKKDTRKGGKTTWTPSARRP